ISPFTSTGVATGAAGAKTFAISSSTAAQSLTFVRETHQRTTSLAAASATKRRLPTPTAREYPNCFSNGSPELTRNRSPIDPAALHANSKCFATAPDRCHASGSPLPSQWAGYPLGGGWG